MQVNEVFRGVWHSIRMGLHDLSNKWPKQVHGCSCNRVWVAAKIETYIRGSLFEVLNEIGAEHTLAYERYQMFIKDTSCALTCSRLFMQTYNRTLIIFRQPWYGHGEQSLIKLFSLWSTTWPLKSNHESAAPSFTFFQSRSLLKLFQAFLPMLYRRHNVERDGFFANGITMVGQIG